MAASSLKTFVHPHSVYRLEYPSEWEQVVEKDGASCGFGPHDRHDVGLWISILPMTVDTDRIPEELPKLIKKALKGTKAANLREDSSLKHYGLIADITEEGQSGYYWIVAGGDVVLFASSQIPVEERDIWNSPFRNVMATLQITRDDELMRRKIGNQVMAQLKELEPNKEYTFEHDKICGSNREVYLTNLFREVRATPRNRVEIIKRFVDALVKSDTTEIGHEAWETIQGNFLPMLKHKDYFHADGPSQHLLTREWLEDVFICYVIFRKKMFRFVTGWDVERWGADAEKVHELAMSNLARLSWPGELGHGRGKEEGRIIVVTTDDSLASSRLLHPTLHQFFAGALGSPFWAGIPCRDKLIVYSDRRHLKQRMIRRLRKEHDDSAYAITPKPFLVTQDGITPALEKSGPG